MVPDPLSLALGMSSHLAHCLVKHAEAYHGILVVHKFYFKNLANVGFEQASSA